MGTNKLHLFILSLAACASVSAQNIDSIGLSAAKTESSVRYYRHEVNVSRTAMFLRESQWNDYENKAWSSLAYEREHDNGFRWFSAESSSGTLISYYYHFNNYLAVGGIVAFTTHEESISGDYMMPWYPTGYKSQYLSGGEIKAKSTFLMPSVKLYCLNSSWCSLYVKLSGGVHLQHFSLDNGEIPLKNEDNLSERKTSPVILVTPFGWEVGKQNLRGFIELGLGSNTNLQIGLTYRFWRMIP